MQAFHDTWSWVAVLGTGIVGVWGVWLAFTRRHPEPVFRYAVATAIAVMLVQVGAGLVLYAQGMRAGDGFHVFYGVVIAATFALAYVYRPQLARRRALSYGLLLLFVMGLALRAWAYVA